MSINEEIFRLKSENGVEFDSNLYVAVMLGAITKRHILVSSSDPKITQSELQLIIRRLWKLEMKVLRVGEGLKLGMKDIIHFFASAANDQTINAIYIIIGIDKLSTPLQSVVLEIIKTKKVEFGDVTYRVGELFTVVGVVNDFNQKEKQLFKYLQEVFWFKQPHDPSEQLTRIDDKCNPKISNDMIRRFKSLGEEINAVVIVPEMKRYIYDIVIFVRTHRCVSTGLRGNCIRELEVLSKALCVLFNKGFVIPSIIKLASRKLLPLEIKMIKPEHEPSLQWGSDPELVKELMKRMSPHLVVEDVLKKVSPPV